MLMKDRILIHSARFIRCERLCFVCNVRLLTQLVEHMLPVLDVRRENFEKGEGGGHLQYQRQINAGHSNTPASFDVDGIVPLLFSKNDKPILSTL